MTAVGVILPTREALRLARPGLLADVARAAEAHGFASVWVGDSLLARPLYDPLAVLAHVSAVTTRVTLGTGVLLAPLRPTVLTARELASIDQLSGGRVVAGLGLGFDLPETRREFAAAGVPFDDRARRLTSMIGTWRALWSDRPVTVDGRDGPVPDVELRLAPARPGGPPIWLTGGGAIGLARVGRLGDGWLPYPPDAADYRRGWSAVRTAAAAAGREPGAITPAVMVTVAVGSGADETLDRYVESFYGYPRALVGQLQACVAGSTDEVLSALKAFWDAGAEHVVLRIAELDDPLGALDVVAGELGAEISGWRR